MSLGELGRTWRGRSIVVVALGALAGLAIAGMATAQTSTVRFGNLILTISGEVKPKALPKDTLAPITLDVGGKISTVDEGHPPALEEAIVDTDKNGAVNAKGLAVCPASRIQSTDTRAAEATCPDAIIGTGTANVQIKFPEQPEIPANSKLVAFNGGVKGGVTTILIYAYLTVPTPAAIVTTVKITKEHKGRFGLHSVASVPTIAGGSGSVTSFTLSFHRLFTYKGKRQSYFEAKCADGKFLAQAEAIFRNGEKIKGSIVVPCTSKG